MASSGFGAGKVTGSGSRETCHIQFVPLRPRLPRWFRISQVIICQAQASSGETLPNVLGALVGSHVRAAMTRPTRPALVSSSASNPQGSLARYFATHRSTNGRYRWQKSDSAASLRLLRLFGLCGFTGLIMRYRNAQVQYHQ